MGYGSTTTSLEKRSVPDKASRSSHFEPEMLVTDSPPLSGSPGFGWPLFGIAARQLIPSYRVPACRQSSLLENVRKSPEL